MTDETRMPPETFERLTTFTSDDWSARQHAELDEKRRAWAQRISDGALAARGLEPETVPWIRRAPDPLAGWEENEKALAHGYG